MRTIVIRRAEGGHLDELEAAEASQFERSPPPITPRRTLAAMAALALGIALSRASPEAPAAPKQRDPRLFYEDFVEIPPLSPAEQLVAFFFRPQAMATQREAAPTAKRRAARASSPQMSVAATSLACADEPPPLRTPKIRRNLQTVDAEKRRLLFASALLQIILA